MAKKKAQMPLMDMGLVKGLSHPLRQEMLYLLATPVSAEAAAKATENGCPGPDEDGLLPRSPNSLSVELEEALGNVSYHMKALVGHGCVELITTRPRRGAVEHFYLPTETAKMRLMALASIGPELGANGGGADAE